MQKLICAACFIMTGCTAPTHPSPKQVAEQLFERFNRHEWLKLEELYSPDAKFTDPTLPQPKVGTVGMTDFYKTVPDIRDSVTNLFEAGGQVTVEFLSTGTLPSGVKFRTPICSILTVKEGKIIEDHTYYNITK